jgi:hypothetical protein
MHAYHVRSVVVGSYPHEKEQIPDVLKVPQVPSFMDTNIAFDQGKSRCMSIIFPSSLYFIMLYLFMYILCTYV